MNTIKYILTLMVSLLCLHLQARQTIIPIDSKTWEVLGATSISGSSTSLEIAEESSGQPSYISPLRKKVQSARAAVLLDLGEDYELGDAGFIATINYTVEYFKAGVSTGTIPNQTLEANTGKPEILKIYDFQTALENSAVDEIIFTNISLLFTDLAGVALHPTGDADLIAHLNTRVRVTYSYQINYGIDVRLDGTPALMAAAPIITPMNIGTLVNRWQTFAWTPNNSFPNYEFQLLRLYNIDPANANNAQYITAKVDWTKALKVETQMSDPILGLTVAEGTGFYLWRVRPIGNYFDGGIANSNNYGAWSSALAQGQTISMNSGTVLGHPDAFYFTDADEDINWSYSRVFTEGDNENGVRTAESIAYADGLGRGRQQQSYLSTQNEVMVGQSIPDFNGASAISVLPVPIPGHLDKYKVGLVQSSTGGIYTAKHYDDDSNYHEPEAVDDGGAPYSYWSDANMEGVADAEGFPFSRTITKNDGTGRVSEVSGVGKIHSLGTRTNGRGRTTRILYGSPSDDELIRIFGDEAPLASSVLKTITIDPDDIVRVTYTSKEGHVIATALGAFHDTQNLSEIDAAHTQGTLTVDNTTTENTYIENRFFSNRRIVLPKATDVTLSYSMDCNQATWGCAGDGNCKYNVRFHLYDITTGDNFISKEHPVDLNTGCVGGVVDVTITDFMWVNQTGSAVAPTSVGPVITMPAGEYMITKEVYSNMESSFVGDQVASVSNEIEPLLNIVTTWLDAINDNDDYVAFELALSTLISDIDQAHLDAQQIYLATDYENPLYQQEFDVIRGEYGLEAAPDFVFNPDVVLEYTADPNSDDPAQFSYTTSCCGQQTVDVGRSDQCVECDAMEAARALGPLTRADTVLNPFMVYLNNQVTIFPWSVGAPGFNELSMEFMLMNMINSKYYTGYSIDNGSGLRVKAEFDINGDFVAISPEVADTVVSEFNYDCKELLEAWKAAVDLYVELSSMTFDDTDIFTATDDEQGNGTSESMFDDEEFFDSGVLNWLAGTYLSVKMKNFSLDGGMVSEERLGAMVTLPYIFMSMAGYQYAAVLDDNVTLLTDYPEYDDVEPLWQANQDYPTTEPAWSALGTWGTAEHGTHSPFLSVGTEYELFYPNVLRPEWMFKYYVYNSAGGDIADFDEYIKRFPHIELQMCYEDPEEGCTPLCGVAACTMNHLDWDMTERLNYYMFIKHASTETFEADNIEDLECPTVPELADMLANRFDAARAAVAARAAEIKVRIAEMLLDNCYIIVECVTPGSTNEVSEAEIDGKVAQVILLATSTLDDMEEEYTAPGDYVGQYPACALFECFVSDAAGICTPVETYQITLLAPCDQDRIDQIVRWNFLPAMPPVAGCINAPSTPDWYGEPDGCPNDALNLQSDEVSGSTSVSAN